MKITEESIHYLDSDTVALEIKNPFVGGFDFVLIDKEDVHKIINKSLWFFKKGDKVKTPYVMVALGKRNLKAYLHLYILNEKPPKGMVVHHRFSDTLDNRKSQLKVCTIADNTRHQNKHLISNATSKYKGVSKNKGKWSAQLMYNRKAVPLGRFVNEIDAAKAYNEGALKYFGEFAKLNVIE